MDRLRENTVVTISLPTGGNRYRIVDFEATVIAVIESGAALHPIGIDHGVLPARAEDVFLTFVHQGQLVGLKGALTYRHQGGGLRFQVADGVQRRRSRYTRVDAELPVTVTRAGGGETTTGTTVNVAPEGLLVKAPLDVELGESLSLALTVPGQPQPLRLSAAVVRHGGGLFAVHFPGDPMARAVVAEFVVEHRAAQLFTEPIR
ncbi:PilZ domain-containing protein [Solirubrobacter taibaiensis]|nr:PilZ domain-containing protein [Solirubrobacter taibaiensis]